MNKALWSALIISLLLGVEARAQTQQDGAVPINGGLRSVFVKPVTRIPSPEQPDPAGLVTIYSNLGKGDNVYNANAGSGILGPDTGQPWPESVACAFIPTADHTVTEIRVGTTYSTGTNAIVVSLNPDNGGKPGKTIHAWKFTNLPSFGSCCTLQTGRLSKGVQVKKGKQYWVVVRPTTAGTDTWAIWNDNFQELQGTFSNNIGSGWDTSFQVLGAFGVFGR